MVMIGGSDMEGILFYWLFWLFWILSTFFADKRKSERLKVSVWLLIAIILSLQTISINGYEISMTSLFMILTTYISISRLKTIQITYYIVSATIVMLAYTSFLLFELYDPVWVVFDREWLLAVVLTYVTVVIQGSFQKRVTTMLIGVIHGELLFAFILKQNSLLYFVGAFATLDIISLTIAMILAWSGFEKLTALFENHINHLEREKQKIS